MYTHSESPVVIGPLNDWDIPVRKAFDELHNTISGLPHRLTCDNVLMLQSFVTQEVQHVASAFNAYFDGIGIEGCQDNPEVVLSSEFSNLQTSEDFFVDMISAPELEVDCNRLMASWENKQSSELDCSSYRNSDDSAGDRTFQSSLDTFLVEASAESESLATLQVAENRRNSFHQPSERLAPDTGVCPRDLVWQHHTTSSILDVSSDQNSDCSDPTLSDHGDDIASNQSSSTFSVLASYTDLYQSDPSEDFRKDLTCLEKSGQLQHDDITSHDNQTKNHLSGRQRQRSCSQVSQENDTLDASTTKEAVGSPKATEMESEILDDRGIEQQTTTDEEHFITDKLVKDSTESDERCRIMLRLRLKQSKSPKTRRKHRTRTSTQFETQLPQYAQQGLLTAFPCRTEEVFRTFVRELGNSDIEQAGFLTRLYHAVASPDAFLQLQETLKMARACVFPEVFVGGSSVSAAVRALDSLDSISSLSHMLRRYYLVRLLQFRIDRENSYKISRQRERPKRILKYDISRMDTLKGKQVSNTQTLQKIERNEGIHGRADSLAIRDLYALVYLNGKFGDEVGSQEDVIRKKRLEKLKTRLACARTWFKFTCEFSAGILALIPCGGDYKISIEQVERLPTTTLEMFLSHLRQGRGDFISSVSQRLSSDIFNILSRQDSNTSQFALEMVDELSLLQMFPDSHDIEMLCRKIE